jgi:hypothetical protein
MSAPGQGDQVFVHGGVAGERDGAVRCVEPVGERRNCAAVRHGHGADLDDPIVEDDGRDVRDIPGWYGNRDVGSPDQRARVRHVGVQRHDVQMVGVAGQDVLGQVRGAGAGRSGWIVVWRWNMASPSGSVLDRDDP